MKAKFNDVKKIKTHMLPPIGNFAIEDPIKDVRWDHCREQFAAKFNEDTVGFYFSHPNGFSQDVGEFLTKFEIIVGVKNNSVFSKTERNDVTWIQPSLFWRSCYLRRSLLTLILRCSMNYRVEKDNFDDALFGDYKECLYIKETKPALLRFMFGFTQFNGKLSTKPIANIVRHGWREEFLRLDEFAIRRRLISPENVAREMSIVGVETLWN
jgi:hypothetical protein